MEQGMENIVSVVLTDVQQNKDSIVVMQEITLDDGSVVNGKHTFPVDTLEWRAAEYGIDPADTDTLVDIVIHEPFLGEPDNPEMLLYDAPSVDDAREYHLTRIKEAKERTTQPGKSAKSLTKQKGKIDLIRDQIKSLSVINPEAVEIKQAFVRRGREKQQKENEIRTKSDLRALFVQPVDPEVERLKKLREYLSPVRPTATLQGAEE